MEDQETGRAVRINWVDSGLLIEGWHQVEDLVGKAPVVETVGIWLGTNVDVIAIASTRGDGGAWLNVQLIWRPAVVSKEWL